MTVVSSVPSTPCWFMITWGYTMLYKPIYPYLSNILRIVMTWLARFLGGAGQRLGWHFTGRLRWQTWLGNPQVWTGKSSADGFWLVVWNMNFMTFHPLGIIILTDFHIFQMGRYTTNQLQMDFGMCWNVIRPIVERWMWCSCMVRPVVRRRGFIWVRLPPAELEICEVVPTCSYNVVPPR